MRKGLIATGAVVLVGGVSAALYSKSISNKDSGFKTVAVVRGPVVEKALAVGALRPKHEITVKSKISGIVRRSFREVGDLVTAGDPLFEILPDPTPLELTEARREVEIAKNVYEQARRKSDRAVTLRAQGIMSTQEAMLEFLREAALADSGFAGNQHDATLARLDLTPTAQQQLKLFLPSYEWRQDASAASVKTADANLFSLYQPGLDRCALIALHVGAQRVAIE